MARSILSRDFLHQLIDLLPVEVIIFDRERNIVLQNKLSRDHMRLPSFDAFLTTIHPEEREKSFSLWNTIFADLPFEDTTIRRLTSDGNYLWFEQKVMVLGDFILGTFFDVHRSHTNQDRRTRLLAGVTHDLRTPLTSARLKAQVAARISGDQRFIDVYLQIVKDMDRAEKMICDLLDTGKFEAGITPELRIAEYDLGEEIEEIVKELCSVHGNRFRFTTLPGVRGYWDIEAIRRVLDNLLANAMKYGEREKAIEIRMDRAGDNVLLEVINHGVPIPAGVQSSLFESYDRAGLKEGVGWGLGLSVARELCEAHHGAIAVRSSDEEGTVFTVTLPLDARRLKGEKS